jgi:hypothetical protein
MPSVNIPFLIELLLKRHERLYDLWIRSQNTSIEEALDRECHALFRIIYTLQNSVDYDAISIPSQGEGGP